VPALSFAIAVFEPVNPGAGRLLRRDGSMADPYSGRAFEDANHVIGVQDFANEPAVGFLSNTQNVQK
jgi:hypothetical protein